MNRDIISLQEISAANWQAKYRGNYGIYTIKIKLNADNKKSAFSPSTKTLAVMPSKIKKYTHTIYEIK